jgi:hypothetical protein
MSSLASEDIALRAALLWVFGIFVIAIISGYSVRTYKGRRASWWLFIPTLVGMGCLMLGPAGLGLLVGRATSDLDEVISVGLIASSGIAAYWLSSVIVQSAQNVAYRIVGAPIQRIRFIGGKARRLTQHRKSD